MKLTFNTMTGEKSGARYIHGYLSFMNYEFRDFRSVTFTDPYAGRTALSPAQAAHAFTSSRTESDLRHVSRVIVIPVSYDFYFDKTDLDRNTFNILYTKRTLD